MSLGQTTIIEYWRIATVCIPRNNCHDTLFLYIIVWTLHTRYLSRFTSNMTATQRKGHHIKTCQGIWEVDRLREFLFAALHTANTTNMQRNMHLLSSCFPPWTHLHIYQALIPYGQTSTMKSMTESLMSVGPSRYFIR